MTAKIKRLLRRLMEKLGFNNPTVGIAVIIFDGNCILFGKRANTEIGSGLWQLSGGHLEFGETIEECAKREVMEETRLQVTNLKIVRVTNNIYRDHCKHYVTIWLRANVVDPSRLRNMEVKCEEWKWFPVEEIPSPRFESSGVLTVEELQKIQSEV